MVNPGSRDWGGEDEFVDIVYHTFPRAVNENRCSKTVTCGRSSPHTPFIRNDGHLTEREKRKELENSREDDPLSGILRRLSWTLKRKFLVSAIQDL